MQENVVISERKIIQDLGTGKSYINLFIREEKREIEDGGFIDEIIAGQQLLLNEPVTRDRIIDLAVRSNYPNGASEAAIRKGIVNKNDPDFMALDNFIKEVKMQIDNG